MSSKIGHHLKKYLAAYLIGLMGCLTSWGLFYALQIQEERHILSIAELGIETINNDLLSELSFDTQVIKHIAITENKTATQTAKILELYPRFYCIAKVDASLDIQTLTVQKNISFKQKWLIDFLHQAHQQIVTTALPWVSTPRHLSNGDLAFFITFPVKEGYLIALINSASLFYHSTEIPGLVFDVYLNHQDLSQNEQLPSSSQLMQVSQHLYGATWDIKVRQKTTHLGMVNFLSHETPLSWIILLLGISISILLIRSIVLSILLKERTIVLDKINQDLKREITEHIQTEESKKNLEKALLQGQKLQAIGTLAGGIAHDFNNILYAIRGYVELTREELPKESLAYKNLGKVLEGTFRGQDLVARILSFSRRQHHDIVPLDLKTEILGALSLLRPTIPESVALEFHPTSTAKILGNKTQIHQVIVNLINNAVDAMDSEGTITISLAVTPVKGMLPTGNYCKIDISDTGHGMDPSTMERIFEPFFTTKEVGKGTGLGLSTVHAIVKEHHGEIIVNSQLGKGTTFTIFFPEYIDA